MTPLRFIVIVLLFLPLACSGYKPFRAPEPLWDDREHLNEIPEEREIDLLEYSFDRQIPDQIEQGFDLSRQFRNVLGKRKQAFNVDAFDEVANSSWFTNRNAVRPVSLDEFARGPDTSTGPSTSEVWTVVGAKAEGVTPGFSIRDSKGDRYLIKFDPMGFSELATGAEMVSTKIFHAAGFHTPENYLVYFDPKNLKIGDNVGFTDKKGRKRAMTDEDFREILARIEQQEDGRIRAVASKFISGKPLGPFKYKGTRKDDPNDIVPHDYRRELRGLQVMAAWLNHFDAKAHNSLDVLVSDNGKKYVRHYLIDFGSTLGSAALGPKLRDMGNENFADPNVMFANFLSLGLAVRSYEKLPPVKYPSIGRYESSVFHPKKFKPQVPNPAFELMTNLDGYWGAKLVTSFTDEQLRVAVKAGQYSDPKAEAYLLQTLIERRNIVGRFWFSQVNPLDKFKLTAINATSYELCFVDLAVEKGFARAEESRYTYCVRKNGQEIIKHQETGLTCLSFNIQEIEPTSTNGDGTGEDQWEIEIRTRRGADRKWSKSVQVYLEQIKNSRELKMIGLKRQD
ncbi:hypothetical protein MJD09_01345 [bacterium]|nr:hypothetical protein [bacterium]